LAVATIDATDSEQNEKPPLLVQTPTFESVARPANLKEQVVLIGHHVILPERSSTMFGFLFAVLSIWSWAAAKEPVIIILD
jgi:hypothetical protein